METVKFALGLRMDAGAAPSPENCAALLLRNLDGISLKGLTLWGGEQDGVFTLVIMGGSLKRMRAIHRAALSDSELMGLLAGDMPFIENNRIAKLKDMRQLPITA